MRIIIPLLFISFLSACNLVQWNQNQLAKKYERKEVVSKFFKSDKHTLHYYEGGEGETVLLIQGFGADAQMTWNQTILDLATDHHVIAPDLLWFGKSSSLQEPCLESQIEVLQLLLKEIGVQRCAAVGISYGGFVALGLANAEREIVNKLCIVDSPGMTYDLSLLDSMSQQQNEASYIDVFVLKTPNDVQELMDLSSYKSRKIPTSLLEDIHALYFSEHHEEQRILLTTLTAEKDKLSYLTKEDLPKTMIIWGSDDHVFPISEGRKLADYLDAELKVVSKSGHAPNLENFSEFQAFLREFLDKD